MRLAMPQVARRRTDQLGDLMAVLEFGAVNLDAGASIAKQRFSDGFNHSGFAAAGWTKKKKIAYRTPRRVQAGQEHLIDLNYFFDRCVLADDSTPQSCIKLQSVIAAPTRIKRSIKTGLHMMSPCEPSALPGQKGPGYRLLVRWAKPVPELFQPQSQTPELRNTSFRVACSLGQVRCTILKFVASACGNAQSEHRSG